MKVCSILENSDYDPWKHQEHDDPVSKQRSWSHQLDVLHHKLIKLDRDGLITVDPFPSSDVGKHRFEYKLRKGNAIDYRYVTPVISQTKLLNRRMVDDHERLLKRIRMIVDRINQIFDLGGAYF